jgi:hypothetical protein
MIQGWVHSRDLSMAMKAMGYDKDVAGKHDLEEWVPAKDLKFQVEKFGPYDPWFVKYVEQLNPNDQVNVGMLNPHLAASMFKWGDSRQGIQNGMDPHRLSDHHNGNSNQDVDWMEKAMNFVFHHVPREHVGIQHRPIADWSTLEDALAHDAAINTSEVGKAIARDAAKMMQQLELEGRIVPWHKMQEPVSGENAATLERAYLVAQQQVKRAENLAAKQLESAKALLKPASAELKKAAKKVLDTLSQLHEKPALAKTVLAQLRGAKQGARTEADRKLVEGLAQLAMSRFASDAVRFPKEAKALLDGMDALTNDLAIDSKDFFPRPEIERANQSLSELESLAQEVEEKGDHNLAATYRAWNANLAQGFGFER